MGNVISQGFTFRSRASNSLGIRSIATLLEYPLDIRIKIFGIMRVYACVFMIFINAHCLWRVAHDICVV